MSVNSEKAKQGKGKRVKVGLVDQHNPIQRPKLAGLPSWQQGGAEIHPEDSSFRIF